MNNFPFLVIGGAGYIGSHLVKALIARNAEVIVVDDLSSGKRESMLGGKLIVEDFSDKKFIDQLLASQRFAGIFHFASKIVVGESVTQPALYYSANTVSTLNLLEAVRKHNAGPIVFSSTAAVYGEPEVVPIPENHPKNPTNPYGRTKLAVEWMLEDFQRAYKMPYVALRYFNAAGADPLARIGEQHDPETHLIPLAIQAVLGKRPPLMLFGQDYDTPDGTCIRDYIHVDDLAEAHILAMQYLQNGGPSGAFNLGNGNGYSVKEVIELTSLIAGKKVPFEYAPRRPGDPARLVANASLAKQVLGWTPQYHQLETIIRHAYNWEISR